MAMEIARHVEAVAPAPGAASRGKSSAGPANDNSAFGAVLASIEDAPAAGPSASAGDTGSGTPEEPIKLDGGNAPADVATAAPQLAADTAPLVVDPSALLLAQSTLGAVNVVPSPVREISASSAAPVDAAVITGVVASAGRLADPQTAPDDPGLPTTPLVAQPAAATRGAAKDTGTVDSPSAALGVALLGRADGKKDGAHDPLRAAAPAQDASAVAASRHASASVAAAAAATDASAQARVPAPAAETAAAVPAMVTALADEMPTPWRRLERAPEGATVHAGLASGNDTALAASPFVTAPDAAGAGAAANGAGFTERLVEQVSWWMAQRSQGAELKLDMPDGAPVSVTVQVTGNEAHVAFRSDSPEARQWLGAALPQLKEMFGSEGLMLSGASVGHSGTGAEQEAARDAQRALRSNGVAGGSVGPEPAALPAARPRTMTERALDLYV